MSGRIPSGFIDELLNRIDIVEVIERHVPLKKAGRDYKGLCPFHNEKTPSFTVSQTKQFYYCFGCGASGSAIGFLIDYAHMDFVDAVEDLATRVGMQVPMEAVARPGPDLSPLYDQLAAAQRYFSRALRQHPEAARAVDYLKRRGLSGEIAASFEIGFAPPGWDNLSTALGFSEAAQQQLLDAGLSVRGPRGVYDRFRDRIMFPIHDQRGRVVAFGGRIIDQGEPKYLNSPETAIFHKGRELYGLHHARKANPKLARLLVVEGYMDVVALAQFGITNAVATLGTATTRDHLERVFRQCDEIIFCFDGDAAGRRAAWRALEQVLPLLRDGRIVGFHFLPAGSDPDTLVRAEGPDAFRDPDRIVPLSEFLFSHLGDGVDLGSLDGRARLAELARPLCNRVPGGVYRSLLIEKLGELTRLDERQIETMFQTGHRRVPVRKPSVPGPSRRSPSLIRTVVALLLHNPRLALKVDDPSSLGDVAQPGMGLLMEMLELIRSHPDITGGGLIEHWRDTEYAPHVRKLLSLELTVPESGMEAEFDGAIARLRAQSGRRREGALVAAGAKPSELSESDKARLRAALRRPHERGE
jgi:DNA primase